MAMLYIQARRTETLEDISEQKPPVLTFRRKMLFDLVVALVCSWWMEAGIRNCKVDIHLPDDHPRGEVVEDNERSVQ